MKIILAGAMLVLFGAFQVANADCSISEGRFLPETNDQNTFKLTVSGNGVCDKTFNPGTRQFKSLQIVAKPKQGSLNSPSPTQFSYKAKAGFKGADAFTIKVCATGSQGTGCSTLNYDVSVQ